MGRKALILIGLAVAPAAATAAPAPTSVTIAADPLVVTYGSSAHLSGAVSPAKAMKVQVSGEACIKRQSQQSRLTVTSTAQGAWTANVTPTSKTVYQAKAKSTDSPALTVQVRPSVALAKVGKHRFRMRITAGQSFGGRIGLFQKRTATGWRTIKSVVLVELGSGNGTFVSGKTFRSGIRARRIVRMLLTQRQAGECYLGATSGSIRS